MYCWLDPLRANRNSGCYIVIKVSIIGSYLTGLEMPRQPTTQSGTKHPISRSIKIQLSFSQKVHRMVRQFSALVPIEKYSLLSVSFDMTPKQINLFKSVKAELNTRIANGETNIKVKYRNGVPCIVTISDPQNSENWNNPTEYH